MKIAILGSRGMPLDDRSFGGFEAFIGDLAPRLVRCGHDVVVYCRRDLYTKRPRVWRGVRLRYLPSIEHKVLGTPLHMLVSTLDAVFRSYDAILVVNSGNGIQCGVLRLFTHARLALNMDGVEWQRGKWGRFGRWYFRFASRWGARFVHTPIVDSRAIGDLYRKEFDIFTTYIPYAIEISESPTDEKVRRLGLVRNEYGLVVGRLIPENFTDVLVEGFQNGLQSKSLVVVGGANYESDFHQRLRVIAKPTTLFLGHVHDRDLLWQLFKHSRVYLHGHSVGGTNPALLQALAAECLVGANDVVFNREVLAGAGRFFRASPESVASVARELWTLPEDAAVALRRRARARLEDGGYTWTHVVAAYVSVLSGQRLR